MVATLLRRGRLLLALALTACLTPSDPNAGDVGELRIRARYAAGAEPGTLGVNVDSAAVVADPEPDPAAPAVDDVVDLPAPDAALGWLVDVVGDTAVYHVRLTLSGDGLRLYEGEADVAVLRGGIGSGVVHDVPVTYVGPGAIAEITVTPGSATLVAAGATQPFAAVARDADGDVVEATFTWTSGDGAVAMVDAVSGVATAVATGVTTISAAAKGKVGGATLTVAEGGLFVELTPAGVTLPAIGAMRQFTATARDASGSVLTDAEFSWTAVNPAVVSVDPAGLATAVAEGSGRIIAETGGVADTAEVGVAVVAAVEVSPATATVAAVGATQQYTAVARRANGDPVEGVEFAWSSSDETVATVDPTTGLATAVANGDATISASAGAASGTATLTVAQVVASVEVAPGSATLTAAGATQAFTAVVRDSNGNPVSDVAVAWSSSDPSAAGVDPGTGVATAVATGQTDIVATADGASGSAILTVALGGLVVSVTPDAATITALGDGRQLEAAASDAAGTPIPDAAFTWTTRDPVVATVDPSGLVTALAEGNAWIVASTGDGADSAAITVAVAATVEVSPASAMLTALGHTQAFTAVVRDAAGDAIPGADVSWTSDAPAVATVDPVTGVATAVGNGTAVISAASGAASGSAVLTVAQAVAVVEVTPGAATLEALDATQAFTALARDENGNPVTRPVAFTWSTTRLDVALVDAVAGTATAVGNGEAAIVASAEGVSGQATLTVDQRVTAVEVTPAAATLTALGDAQAFTAVGRDANGATVPDAGFVWTTSDSAVATVDAGSGLVTAVGNGGATVTATADGAVAGALVTVRQAVAGIAVTPSAVTLEALGETAQLKALAEDANGNQLTRPVTLAWSSDRPEVAAVDAATGLVTAMANGAAAVTVSAEGVSAVTPVTVAQVVVTVEVTPGAATLDALGDVQAFGAVARDARGNAVDGVAFAWSSGAPAVATVDPATGLALAVGNGTAVIAASAAGVAGEAALTVRQVVTSIEVTPADATLTAVGATQQYAAAARDANGNLVADAVVAWETSDAGVATVNAVTGLATAVADGTASITARADGAAGTGTLTVCVHREGLPTTCVAGAGGSP